jgi:HK97 family phage major capsid protein/HK97 family phage prohead protease
MTTATATPRTELRRTTAPDTLERRTLPAELRAAAPDTRRLVGTAIVFNQLSEDLGGFRERIAPEAMRRTVSEQIDVRAYADHDPARVLGRVSNNTLRLTTDTRGVQAEIDLPETSYANDVLAVVRRGDLRGMSFAFQVMPGGERWEAGADGVPVRVITDMRVSHISPVSEPAYAATDVAVARRSLESWRGQSRRPAATDGRDLTPPIPPVVSEPSDTEVRVLGREQSVRSWIEARSRHPREFAQLRLGDVMRAMITGPRTDLERRALSEGTDSAGGYTVPDIVLARFIDRLRAAVVVIRAGAQTVPLTSDVTRIARLAADPTAAWRAENAAVAESDPTFEAVTFTARSLDVQMKVSRELVEDSLNIAEMLETALLRSFSVEVDRVCLHGTGTPPQPRGIRNVSGVGEVSMGTNGAQLTNHDKLIDTLTELWTDNVTTPTALVLAPRTLTTESKFKEGTTNAPLPRPPVLTTFPWYQTTSMPITETQGSASNASSVFIGDFTQMMLGFRTEMQIEVARELYRGNYQFGFFGHLRMDMQVTHPESFTRLIGIIP